MKPAPTPSASIRAFTLVELSIVIVIIGLIVGGIVGGQSLLQSATRGKIISEFSNIRTTINTFYVKYDYLPGDFPFAFDHWGHPACGSPSSTWTCNGNGNGRIINSGGGNWEHGLAIAHLVAGMGSAGIPLANLGSSGSLTYNEYNLTSPAVKDAYYQIHHSSHWLGSNDATNALILMRMGGGFNYRQGMILPHEAKAIDLKMDDGIPGNGRFRGMGSVSAPENGATKNCLNGSEYRLDSDLRSCWLIWALDQR